MRILLVEDDDSVTAVLEKSLASEHYAVDVAGDGQAGWQMVNSFDYDLIMLDVMLPKLDGLQFCQKLRDHAYHMPVLLLTALDSSTQKIAGLDAGADDYITKPFELAELLARVRVLLRRAQTSLLSVLEWEDLRLDPNSQEVTYGDRPVQLTPKEFRLLELFLRKQSQVFTRGGILDRLWSCSEAPGEDTVTAHIRGLRRKLVDVGAPSDLIKTVYGIGYRLKPARSVDPPAPAASASAAERQPPASTCQQKTQAALATLWQSVKSQHFDRLALLREMLQALQTRQVTDDLRYRATRAAHSLAGALGIFGLRSGSELARSIELILQGEAAIPPHDQKQLAQLIKTLDQELHQASSLIQPVQSGGAAPLLVIVDDDLSLIAGVSEGISQHLQVQTALDEAALQDLWPSLRGAHPAGQAGDRPPAATAETASPDVILLNLSLTDSDRGDLRRLSQLINQVPSLLVLVCSRDDRLANRVKAAQLGSQAFLPNPDVAAVLKSVFSVRSRFPASAHKVMIVDDDPQILQTLQTFLEPQGFQLITLNQPLDFWATLQAAAPDLLLLDIEMPKFNGLELCRTVRQAPIWNQLPIIFFTAHGDANTKAAALRAGANDLVEKSLTQSTLLDRLFEQLKQSQLQQAMTAIAEIPI
ncbi:MAG: response regulator [Cyanobacteria bacterium J06607_6]